MKYITKIYNDILTLCFENEKEYQLHYSSNFDGDYSPPPTNLFIKTDMTSNISEIISKQPSLMKKWKNGNFIIDDNIKYERLSQYEYDKYCYENNITCDNTNVFCISTLKLK